MAEPRHVLYGLLTRPNIYGSHPDLRRRTGVPSDPGSVHARADRWLEEDYGGRSRQGALHSPYTGIPQTGLGIYYDV